MYKVPIKKRKTIESLLLHMVCVAVSPYTAKSFRTIIIHHFGCICQEVILDELYLNFRTV